MRTAVVLFLVALFFLISLKSRIAGMYTYWWFGIFRPQDWVWHDLSGFRLPLIAAIIFVVPSLFSRKIPRFNNPLAILMIGYCLMAAFANFLNGCSIEGFDVRTRTVTELLILVYVVLLCVQVIETRKTMFGLMLVVALSLAFHSGKGGIYALMTGASYYDSDQLKGFLSGSNAYALGTAIIIFFMIFCYQRIGKDESTWGNRNRLLLVGLKLILAASIIGSIYNVIATQSRGSFLALIVGLFILFMLQKKSVKLIAVFGICALVALIAVPLPEGFQERIESAFVEQDERDESAESRPHFWKTAVSIANSHPLGVGPGCYPVYYNWFDPTRGRYGYYRSVHSSHFQILSDTGYPGILTWVLLLTLSLRKLWLVRKACKTRYKDEPYAEFYLGLSNTLMASMFVFILGGAFYEFGYNDITWLTFGLVIATETLFKKEIQAAELKLAEQSEIPPHQNR